MAHRIRKAVIPAAGYGTRFLPATKAMPKEMLPIVDKPIIQIVVEEAVAAGIEEIVIVTGWNKRSIEDHFDFPFALTRYLRENGKDAQADEVSRIAEMANFVYIRQKGPYGNGTPILNARAVIGDEPFAILWGDEFIHSNPPRLKQMIDVYEQTGKPNISAVRVPPERVNKYGIADVSPVQDNVYKINRIVEKPKVGEAPGNLAAHGAYLMPPRLFEILADTPTGKDGELWLTDAISKLAAETEVHAVEIEDGKYYDTGNKLEYLKTVVEFGLKHPEINGEFKEFLKQLSL
jgi:UTP--glucose-1-phosphate uridylyltransferase